MQQKLNPVFSRSEVKIILIINKVKEIPSDMQKIRINAYCVSCGQGGKGKLSVRLV